MPADMPTQPQPMNADSISMELCDNNIDELHIKNGIGAPLQDSGVPSPGTADNSQNDNLCEISLNGVSDEQHYNMADEGKNHVI